MKRRILCALLCAALLVALPVHAVAAKKASIKFPVKVGLMFEGKSVALKPKLTGVRLSELTWSSSDEDVLTFSGNTLTAHRPGKAVVTASGGGASAKCGVVVLPQSVTVAVGERYGLPCGGVEKYAVKQKKVATVSAKGVVTGVSAGETAIQVKYGKQKLTLRVSVVEVGQTDDSPVAKLECAGETDQIVLVEYTGGSSAMLSVHQKEDGLWKRLLECNAYVGRNGIGKEKAGDKRTPAGTYNLTTPFGNKADPGSPQDYVKVTKYHYWCGDSSSEYYNQLVDERIVDRKHTAADEYLIDYGSVYAYCLFIDYNAAGVPHKGSCIFLHCTGKNKYTAGCVAIAESNMKKIIQWARPGAKIVIQEKEG